MNSLHRGSSPVSRLRVKNRHRFPRTGSSHISKKDTEEYTPLRRTTLVGDVPHTDTALVLDTAPAANRILHTSLAADQRTARFSNEACPSAMPWESV